MHRHKSKAGRRRSRNRDRRREARQVWKNFAALHSYKALFGNGQVQLFRRRPDGGTQGSTKVSVLINPGVLARGSRILCWIRNDWELEPYDTP